MLMIRTLSSGTRRLVLMGSPNPLSKITIINPLSENNNNNNPLSERLYAIAQQLRSYKPPDNNIFDQIEKQQQKEEKEKKEEESSGVVGFAENVTPFDQRFRFKRAAVLVCLYEDEEDVFNNELRVFLTRRSSNLSSHSGEISLPGGKADEEDADDAATATREAKEEIGLDPSLVNVVTVLEPFLSKHLLRVTPVIGILPSKSAFSPTPNVGEVDEIFDAPLEMFIKDENRRSEEREWMGYKYLIHYFDYETENKKYVIWGLTAGILIRAASVVYQRPPAFQEQYPEFKFPSFVNKDSVLP